MSKNFIKIKQADLNWDKLKKEFFDSSYEDVRTYFLERVGFSKNDTNQGTYLRKTKGWGAEKLLVVKGDYIQKVLLNGNYKDEAQSLLINYQYKDSQKLSAKIRRLAIDEILSLGTMLVLKEIRDGTLSSVDFLKYAKGLIEVREYTKRVEESLEDDEEVERLRGDYDGFGGLKDGQASQQKTLVKEYKPLEPTPEPTE